MLLLSMRSELGSILGLKLIPWMTSYHQALLDLLAREGASECPQDLWLALYQEAFGKEM